MRLPRVRLTIRTIMLAVVIVACLCGALALGRRSRQLRDRAEVHRWEIYAIEEELPPDVDGKWEAYWFSDDPNRQPPPSSRRFYPPGWAPPSEGDPPEIVAWRKSQERRIAFHLRMYQKYVQASRRPWIRTEPDPPGPE